jgi:DNA-binding response OmpR family regulator
MAKILVIEDDYNVRETLTDYLNGQSHIVEAVEYGQEGLDLLASYPYDLIILDLTLPDMDGRDILSEFRAKGGNTPVLILSGRRTVEEKEAGFDSGADDYLVKPFDMRELNARLKALLRRPAALNQERLSIGDYKLDPDSCTVVRKGATIKLQPKEFAMMELFMRYPDKIFSSDALLDRVWESASETSPETVRVHITKLRSKVDVDGRPSIITTIKGVGYKLDSGGCKLD